MSIDVLPDEVLLAIFDFCVDEHPFANDEKKERGVAVTSARVSTMAKRRFWITTSPQSATCLHIRNTREGHAGCLAGLTSTHSGQRLRDIKRG